MSTNLLSFCWRSVFLISTLSLVHCAYSAAQHRSYLRLTGVALENLPVDLVVQTLVSLLLTIIVGSFVAGEFQPFHADLQVTKKPWDVLSNCLSFYVFEHRAKCLSPKFGASASYED